MRLITIFTLFFGLLTYSSYAQDMNEYFSYVKIADSLYEVKDFKGAADNYFLAFKSNDRKAYPNDRYNAACSYALAGEKDSAFFHLYRLAESVVKYSNYSHITKDSDLISLYKDKRWKKLIAIVKANKEEIEKNYDKPLVAELDSIYESDQLYRQQIKGIEEKYGRQSVEMEKHWELIMEKDSINLIRIQEILDTRGWLGQDVIGGKGNSTLFLVIQHSNQKVQEKYLPMMRDAVAKGNADGSSLALLEDRVALGKGELQIYGSQIGRDQETGEFFLLPLIDPDNVDKRRDEVGLGPIQDYVGHWGMTWDVEAYKKQLPELIEKRKK